MASGHQEKDGLHGGKDISYRNKDSSVFSMKEKMKLFEEKIQEQKEPEKTLQLERHSWHRALRTGEYRGDGLHGRLGQRKKVLCIKDNANEHSATDTHSNSASDVNSTNSCRKAFVDELTSKIDKCYNNENKQNDTPQYALSTSPLPPPIQKKATLPPELPPKRVANSIYQQRKEIAGTSNEFISEYAIPATHVDHITVPECKHNDEMFNSASSSLKPSLIIDRPYQYPSLFNIHSQTVLDQYNTDPALLIDENALDFNEKELIEHPPQFHEPMGRITLLQTSRESYDDCDQSYCFDKEGSDEGKSLMSKAI